MGILVVTNYGGNGVDYHIIRYEGYFSYAEMDGRIKYSSIWGPRIVDNTFVYFHIIPVLYDVCNYMIVCHHCYLCAREA